jgi:hypothetical protein
LFIIYNMCCVLTAVGRYTGTGAWYDAQGKTMSYAVAHDMTMTAEGFEVEFTHDFADRTRVHAVLEMSWLTPQLFRVATGSKVAGHGYCLANVCKYHLDTGTAFVEVSYHPTREGLEVFGSSSTNAEGNYIAWYEELRRR